MALKREFVDMDDFISKREQLTVSEIFAQKGEPYFRGLEKELCERFSVYGSKIIATGGGVVKNADNVANLKKGGVVFYLKSTPERINENLKRDNTRPLLETEDKLAKIKELMAEREEFYTNAADITVDVTEKEIEETVQYILDCIKENK